jgi:hypothetical protein
MTDNKQHEEWKVENSLTSPSDRSPDKSYKPNQGHPQLSEDEVVNAMEKLNNNTFVKKFLRVERKYADPVEPMQRIGLISFVPAKGATPNDKGIYGFAKLRGNYPTDNEASERAELLIRSVDSYHKIFHAYVGRPFPLTITSDYSETTDEIDIRKSMTESVSNNIKRLKQDEQKQIQEVEEREKMLLEDCKKDEQDPMDKYTTLKVKKAQITWTYVETEKKLEEMKNIIIKTRKELEEMDKTEPTFGKEYYKRYCDARSESGLDNEETSENFMKFLVDDFDLGF